MKLNILLYAQLIVLYLIFCIFLFNDKIEVLMFVLMFLLTTMTGYKVLYDMYENKDKLNFDFSEILRFFNIDAIFMSPLILVILIATLALFTYLYIRAKVSVNYVMANVVLLGVFFLFNIPSSGSSYYQLFVLYGVPLFMLIMSSIMIMVAASILNGTVVSGKMNLSSHYREVLNTYKGLYVTTIFFLILTLVGMMAIKQIRVNGTTTASSSKSFVDSEKSFNILSLVSLSVSYILSFFTFSESYDIYKYVQFDMNTSDNYNGDFTSTGTTSSSSTGTTSSSSTGTTSSSSTGTSSTSSSTSSSSSSSGTTSGTTSSSSIDGTTNMTVLQ